MASDLKCVLHSSWIFLVLFMTVLQLTKGHGLNEEQFNLTGSYCLQKWTCETQDASLRTCKCDTECDIHGDCCEDAPSLVTESKRPPSPFLECRYFPEVEDESYVYIVQTCPTEANEYENFMCKSVETSDIYRRTPVYGQESGFLYRNMYCAVCHREQFLFLSEGINCQWKYKYRGNYTIEDLMEQDECRLIYEMPRNVPASPRRCFPLKNDCDNVTGDMNYCDISSPNKLCFTEQEIFRNPECALCNNIEPENVSCSSSYARFLPKGKRSRYNYSYRILFDLNSKRKKSVAKYRYRVTDEYENYFSEDCNDDQVYDPFGKTCQDIVCNPPYLFENGACILGSSVLNVSKNITEEIGCPSIMINMSDVQIMNNSEILVISSGNVYTKFQLTESFAYICINQTKQTAEINYLQTYSKEESVLSLVCGVLSVIFLFVAFLIYTCNSKLQNIPGKNLISLISALLMAQLLFILAPLFTNSSPWCAVVAILMHYFFLSSFFWMNVMSFDIFFTFSASFKRSGNRGHSSKRFKYYSLYAWSVPLVLTSVCVIIDVWSISEYRPLYGDVVCWITNPRALLVFFLIPLGIILFSNILFFIITAKNIYISEHNTAKVLKKKESCKLLIYIKLSVVMGMTWIFGFVATGVDNVVWWYLFIIFNGLQGVFIFMSFVLTPKILRTVSDRVRTIFTDNRSYSMFGKGSSSTKSTHLVTTKSEDILVQQDESKC